MSLFKRIERRLSPYAVPNVTLYLIAVQVLTFIVATGQPDLFERLALVPSKVLDGEVWRLISFLAIPPMTNVIFAFFFWYLFYLMGTTLEQVWGVFRYNMFLLIGFGATAAVSFLAPDFPASNGFVQGSVFLAYAWLYPDFQLMIMFILPVKIKWLALLAWIFYFWTIAFAPWEMKLAATAAVLNFFVFFGHDIFTRARYGHRRMSYQARQKSLEHRVRHKCVVCGITDKSHPDMDFRYCSTCDGAHAYCTDHLRNHQHIKTDDPAKTDSKGNESAATKD